MKTARIASICLTIAGLAGFVLCYNMAITATMPGYGTDFSDAGFSIEAEGAFVRTVEYSGGKVARVTLKATAPFPEFNFNSSETCGPVEVKLVNVRTDMFDGVLDAGETTTKTTGADWVRIVIPEGVKGSFYAKEKPADELTFVLYGDMRGGWKVIRRIAADVEKIRPAFVMCLGDLVVNPTNTRYRLLEREFEGRGVPYLGVAGNHDFHDNSPEIFENFYGPVRHTFRINGATFICGLGPNMFLEPDETEWLERELKSAKAAGGPVLVMGHIPPFNPVPEIKPGHLYAGNGSAADRIHNLLKKYKVDFAGFSHFHSLFDYTEEKRDSVPYFITGGGGSKLIGEDPFFHYSIFHIRDGKISHEVVRLPFTQRGLIHLEHWRKASEVLAFLWSERQSAFWSGAAFIIGWLAFWAVFLFYPGGVSKKRNNPAIYISAGSTPLYVASLQERREKRRRRVYKTIAFVSAVVALVFICYQVMGRML